MKFILIVFTLCLFTNSCKMLDKDENQLYSYDDPFYLGINELTVGCSGEQVLSEVEWKNSFNKLLGRYRKSDFRFNFIALRKSSRESLCGLVKSLEHNPKRLESVSESAQLSFWMNTYHVLILNLIVEGFGDINEVGKPHKPEFRSPLNIKQKKLSIFDDFQWIVLGKYRSLNEVEKEIQLLGGFSARISLYRGMKGFGGLPEEVLEEDNIDQYIKQSLYNIVNENIFYDDLNEPKTASLPGSLKIYMSDLSEKELGLRKILSVNLDNDVWGDVLSPLELLVKSNGHYKWFFEFDPVNWQLAE